MNGPLVIYFSIYQIYNNCYSLARVWAAYGDFNANDDNNVNEAQVKCMNVRPAP